MAEASNGGLNLQVKFICNTLWGKVESHQKKSEFGMASVSDFVAIVAIAIANSNSLTLFNYREEGKHLQVQGEYI